jgi:hypothetical protein
VVVVDQHNPLKSRLIGVDWELSVAAIGWLISSSILGPFLLCLIVSSFRVHCNLPMMDPPHPSDFLLFVRRCQDRLLHPFRLNPTVYPASVDCEESSPAGLSQQWRPIPTIIPNLTSGVVGLGFAFS